MAVAMLVDPVVKIMSVTISYARWFARAKQRGTVRFTVHIDADEKSIKVVPEVLPSG